MPRKKKIQNHCFNMHVSFVNIFGVQWYKLIEPFLSDNLLFSPPHGKLLQFADIPLSRIYSTDAIICVVILKVKIKYLTLSEQEQKKLSKDI